MIWIQLSIWYKENLKVALLSKNALSQFSGKDGIKGRWGSPKAGPYVTVSTVDSINHVQLQMNLYAVS